MRLEEIAERLPKGGAYSAQLEDGLLRIRHLETASEFILEAFGQSAQIRQAIWFDCHEFSEEDSGRIYELCSMMNARFSGCKCYIDQWGVLTTGADVLGEAIAMDMIEITLGQIEFVSLAMLDLVEILRTERRPVTPQEIDTALAVPSLQ